MTRGRGRRGDALLGAVLGVIVALLSGCASLGQERPAAEAAAPEAAAAEAGSRLPAPVVADESLARWGEAKAKRYGGYVDIMASRICRAQFDYERLFYRARSQETVRQTRATGSSRIGLRW